jgi:phosphoglycolate phosphatase
VLWDIDLTLVDYSGIGRAWYREALNTVTGKRLEHLPVFPGRTERSIATELLTMHGGPDDEESVQAIFAEIVRIAEAARPDLTTLGRALPGAPEVLKELAERPDVVQSLVTGNLPEVSVYKLEAFGLDRHIDFEVGGYGSLSLDRHDLVADAMALAAAKYRTRFPASSVVVIGDTPMDVQAGLHHGAVAVGVATGRHTEDQLRECGAHAVLPNLADTQATLDALLRRPPAG